MEESNFTQLTENELSLIVGAGLQHSGGWSFWGDDNGEIPFDHID